MTPEEKILSELFEDIHEGVEITRVPCQHYNYRGEPCPFRAAGESEEIPACRFHIKRPRPLPEVHKKENQ